MKRFLRKLAEPVGIAVYVSFSFLVADYAASVIEHEYAPYMVLAVMIVIPVLAFMVKMLWDTAKQEIEIENYKLMRDIKGDN